ncbi:MAG: NAD(P)/FAD-dependent oxidoreductase [Candidatus Omnitrophica bacterium]|nr:NAD(P)/FAD-dependent oxidoreductase [Candidatus Omnitrophota bacterium]
MDEVGITIIGAGVVGLAIAAQLSENFKNIVVVDKNQTFGQESSSRNSEVVHSGIYYPQGSLKMKLCLQGAQLLYDYCDKNQINYNKLGKLIVALNAQEQAQLDCLYDLGVKRDIRGLSLLTRNEANNLEPMVKAYSALYLPNTGIVDSHSLMKSLYRKAKALGVTFAFNSEISNIEKQLDKYVVSQKDDDYIFSSRVVINSAGLGSDIVAGLVGLSIDALDYKLAYCKGSYFSYSKPSPVKRLIYPVPQKDLKGLGVHATIDLAGHLRFGPDIEYVDEIDYQVDNCKGDIFYEKAKALIGGLERTALAADMAGIRPKISGEGVKDFIINHEKNNGFPGLINLIGIESPGLTAALAIGKYVTAITKDYLA